MQLTMRGSFPKFKKLAQKTFLWLVCLIEILNGKIALIHFGKEGQKLKNFQF